MLLLTNDSDVPRDRAILTRHGLLWRIAEALSATVALLLLTPVLVVITLAILADDGGSVLFAQRRIGRYGRPFRILKFRTMAAGGCDPVIVAQPLEQLADHPRLTRVGRTLRRTHLDELPQLLNVITGQMSLVGPRPLVPHEDALVVQLWQERHEHRPGLTGLWQLHRSPRTTVDELIRFDRRYVTSWSPWRDLLIIAGTAGSVLRRSGR